MCQRQGGLGIFGSGQKGDGMARLTKRSKCPRTARRQICLDGNLRCSVIRHGKDMRRFQSGKQGHTTGQGPCPAVTLYVLQKRQSARVFGVAQALGVSLLSAPANENRPR